MTAIYGFASKKDKLAFLFSDDLAKGLFDDGTEFQSRIDKIHYIGRRFSVAMIGNEVTLDAIEGIKILNDPDNLTNCEKVDSIDSLINQIKQGTNLKCLQLKNKNLIRDYIINQSTMLVILDCNNYELFKIDFGKGIPPENLFKPEISPLAESKLHLFALAKIASGEDSIDIDLKDFIKDPKKFMNERIKQDSETIKKKAINKDGIKVEMGKLGTHIIVKEDRAKYYSRYQSIKDFMPSRTSGVIGKKE
jgi:hypothetical protein